MKGEVSLFDFPTLEINKKIRLIELFGGIGSQAMALRDLGADFEHYRLVEFDKYAVSSYNSIHHTNFTTSDIRDIHGDDLGIVEKSTYTYLLTYLLVSLYRFVSGRTNERNVKRGLGKWKKYKKWSFMGSRENLKGTPKRTVTRYNAYGKCTTSSRRTE